jgi:hypothetical protein
MKILFQHSMYFSTRLARIQFDSAFTRSARYFLRVFEEHAASHQSRADPYSIHSSLRDFINHLCFSGRTRPIFYACPHKNLIAHVDRHEFTRINPLAIPADWFPLRESTRLSTACENASTAGGTDRTIKSAFNERRDTRFFAQLARTLSQNFTRTKPANQPAASRPRFPDL